MDTTELFDIVRVDFQPTLTTVLTKYSQGDLASTEN